MNHLASTPLPGFAAQCASETQMITRTAFLFRSNVCVNDCIAVATLVLTYLVLRRLKQKTVFPNSTHVLIWISLILVNAHELIYGFIQNWSLYRSLVYYDQPCKIMFNEYECFNYYIANILVRLLILFTNCALTIDRLITFLFPLNPCSFLRGILLFMLSLAASIVFSFFLVDEPSANVQPNCFVRINRDIDELTDQLLFYFWVCLTCLLLNIFAWCSSCYSLRNKKFILRDQYSKRESLNCAIVLSIILLFQMIAIGFYSISIVFILKFYEFFDHIVMANLILWFYTYPWAALSLPSGIMLATSLISLRRRRIINVMTLENKKEDQKSYFIKLNQTWG